jgi:hypothetical protein
VFSPEPSDVLDVGPPAARKFTPKKKHLATKIKKTPPKKKLAWGKNETNC